MQQLKTALIALVAGFAGAGLFAWSGLGAGGTGTGTATGGESTRDYLMAHPEILPEAMEELQRRDMMTRIEPLRGEIEAPFPGAVLGNPEGSVTLVEFSDYACGFCRSSLDDVRRLIAANADLKVVVREYPMLTPESLDAARMALAAAQQGRYAQFHDAMFAAGRPDAETIEAAARQAGLDLAAANAAIESGAFDGQLQNNMRIGQQIGLTGTPTWIVGDQALNGALGFDRIGRAIAAARGS